MRTTDICIIGGGLAGSTAAAMLGRDGYDASRANFRKLVRRYYGANVPGITSGILLLSPHVSTPPLIEVHIRTSRTLIKDLLKA